MKKQVSEEYRRKKILRIFWILIVLAAAAFIGWHLFQSRNLFQPDKLSKTGEFQENQILFPGQEAMDAEENGTGDSNVLEHDEQAQQEIDPDQLPNADYLFQAQKQIVDGDSGKVIAQPAEDSKADGSDGTGSGGTVFVPSENGSTTIPGGTDAGSGGTGDAPGTEPGEGEEGTEGENPGPSVDPEENPEGDTPGGGSEDPGETEEDPPDVDPDPRPELPKDLYDNEYINEPKPSFPDTGITVEDGQNIELWVGEGLDKNAMEHFYYGAVVDEWKLLCAAYTYVWVDGEPTYRLVSFGENFKVEGYPKRATEDFEVTFSFRPNKDSSWISVKHQYKVYPYKVIVQGENAAVLDTHFLESGESIDMLGYYGSLIPEEKKDFLAPASLDTLVVGWSEEPGGSPVGYRYQPAALGRHVLYLLPQVKLDDSYAVEAQLDWEDYFPHYLQTLCGYYGDAEDLIVPCGIQNVDLYGTGFQTIQIPASVLKINTYWLQILDAYEVDEENPNYCSVDGLLYNKAQTKLYGIPYEIQRVTIPEQVTEINISWENQIREIHIQSETLPEMDLSRLTEAKIYVPSEQYLLYLAAWGNQISSGEILPSDETAESYCVRDGAILSLDGKRLLRILASENGTYTIPAGVQSVEPDAMSDCGVEVLIVPDTVRVLHAQSINGGALQRVIMRGVIPPRIVGDTFPDSDVLEIQVPTEAFEHYLAAWSQVLGNERAEKLLVGVRAEWKEQNGFLYWQMDDTAILVRAPKNLVHFDENSLPGVTFVEIQAKAFADCTSLVTAVIPDSVLRIGKRAFARCSSLQAVIINAEEQISVEANAFESCERLRFVVSLARRASFADEYLASGNGYCVSDAEGYPGFQDLCDHYYIRKQAEGILLYGTGNNGEECYLLNATDNISGEIVLDSGTVEIDEYALQGCANRYTLDAGSMANLKHIGYGAFSTSGLSGKVILPEALESVGAEAFSWCADLEEIEIKGNHLEHLDEYMLYGCSGLKKVTFGEDCTLREIGFGVFTGTALETITLPASLDTLGSLAFEDCVSLQSVTFQSKEPPRLMLFSPGIAFSFGETLPEGFRIILSEDIQAQTYVDAWKYSLLGAAADTELTAEEVLEGEHLVRRLLGLETENQKETLQEDEEK